MESPMMNWYFSGASSEAQVPLLSVSASQILNCKSRKKDDSEKSNDVKGEKK